MGYRLRYRWAAAAAQEDVRSWVTIETDEFPFPVRFYFLRWKDEQGTSGYEYLSYSLESGPVSRDSVEGVDLDGFGPTPEQFRWLKENINTYTLMAKCAIETPWDKTGTRRAYLSLAKRVLPKRIQGRPWTDAELSLVSELVDAYTREGYTKDEIASRVLGCDRSSLYRALGKARKRGVASLRQ